MRRMINLGNVVTGALKKAISVAAEYTGDVLDGIYDGLKSVAGEVVEFMEDMGPILADIVVEYGDFLLEGMDQLIQFIEFFFTGKYETSYEIGRYFEKTNILLFFFSPTKRFVLLLVKTRAVRLPTYIFVAHLQTIFFFR